tara:strand:+ start:95 stop:547 length:453 start_codon:yes stop_codon:yes gene_type:complete
MIKSKHHKFNKECFDAVDAKSREASIRYIESKGCGVQDHPDKYAVDLIATTPEGKTIYVECERRNIWSNGRFPYSSIHIPYRKKKFLELDFPCVYHAWDSNYEYAISLHSDVIKESPVVEVPNRAIESGEYFYDVPINKTKLIKLNAQCG